MSIDPDKDIYLITEEFPDSIKVLAKDGQDRILDDYILLPEVVELPWLAGLSSRKKENAVTDENIFQYGRLLERIEYLESVEDTDLSFEDAEGILATFRLLKDAFHEWFFHRNIDLSIVAGCPLKQLNNDFTVISHGGEEFSLSSQQAKVIKYLFNKYMQGDKYQSFTEIAEALDIQSDKMSDVFKSKASLRSRLIAYDKISRKYSLKS